MKQVLLMSLLLLGTSVIAAPNNPNYPDAQIYQELADMDAMLNESISQNKNQIIDNRQDIENLYKTKADKTEIKTLDSKLDKEASSRIEADNNLSNRINHNVQSITNMNGQLNNLKSDINRLDGRINRLDDKLEGGLATVTALTQLHPNPRFKGRTQIAIGSGMYADNVAGAVGIFHWINDRIMLNASAAYGGQSQWAGGVGISIGL